jgi:glycoprotein 3-alpha-L-fucosyltransferase
MGAHPDDYKKAAPSNSYIHVEDFDSAEDLAAHLKYLAENDGEYNKYFEWKGTGEFIDSQFLCRVCGMLHYSTVNPSPPWRKPFVWEERGKNGLCLANTDFWTK